MKLDNVRFLPLNFTEKEVPESETLINLCMNYPIKAFQIEHVENGYSMTIIHFLHKGYIHFYQNSDRAFSHHLYFWILCVGNKDCEPEQEIIKFFDDQFILSDE